MSIVLANGYGSKDENGAWNGMIKEVLEEVGVTCDVFLATPFDSDMTNWQGVINSLFSRITAHKSTADAAFISMNLIYTSMPCHRGEVRFTIFLSHQ